MINSEGILTSLVILGYCSADFKKGFYCLLSNFLIQSALVVEKRAKLLEILGKVEEEEAEGEALGEESSGNISSTSQKISQ